MVTGEQYISEVLIGNNDENSYCPKTKSKWHLNYLLMTLHTRGVMPSHEKINVLRGAWHKSAPEYDQIFESRIFNRHPNTTHQRYEWQKSIYQPLAKFYFDEAISRLKGVISKDYHIQVVNAATSEALSQKRFAGYAFNEFFTDVLLSRSIDDANGVAVVMPNVEYITNQTTNFEPQVFLIESRNVLFINNYVFAADIGTHKQKKRLIVDKDFYYVVVFDDNNKYIINRVANTTGVLTAEALLGINQDEDGEACKASFFSGAADAANVWLRQVLDVEAHSKDLIPIAQQVHQSCKECSGTGKTPVECADTTQERCTEKCSECNGNGVISRNLGDTYMLPFEDIMALDGKFPDMVKYITPNTEIIKETSEREKLLFERFKETLYMKEAGVNQSGVSKELDRENQNIFILKVARQLETLGNAILQHLDAILSNKPYMSGNVSLKLSTDYRLLSKQDIADGIVALRNAKAPRELLIADYEALATKLPNVDVQIKLIKFFAYYSPLYLAEPAMFVFASNAEKQKFLYMQQATEIVLQSKTKDWLLASSNEVIKSAVDIELAKLVPTQPAIQSPN